MAVIGRHDGKAGNGTGTVSRKDTGHHRQKPLQNGTDPDNGCHTATSEKAEEVSSDDVTFDDENGKAQPEETRHPAQVPDDKLDETFTSVPPEEMEFGEEEPEEDSPDKQRASGSSFDEIDNAVKTAKNPEATEAEQRKAAKVFTDMEGTELYEKMMEGSSEIGIRIKGLIEIRLKKPKKEFVIPDSIEEFDIRNYV